MDRGSESTSLNGLAQPINTVLASPITGFLSIPAAPLTFDLTEVLGTATTGEPPCAVTTTTGSCYLSGTPFNFNTGSGGASLTFSVAGNLNYQGLTAAGVILQYSATFVNQSIGQVLTAFLSTGSTLQSSDAQVTVNVTGPAPPPLAGIYIADSQNNRIRKVSSGTIATFAGNGTGGYSGDAGAAASAELRNPYTVALDSSGNLYIADTSNNVIRMVNTSGIITTVAGNGLEGYSGDGGPATSAQIFNPAGVAVDSFGNLFIADTRENRIRMVNTSGIISTVAGNGAVGSGGDGGPATSAQLYHPAGIAVDGSGNLYIADSNNQRIRKVNASGIITTIAGNGVVGYNCNNGVATSLGLHDPTGVAVDGSGNLYIADSGNQCVRKVNSSGAMTTVAGNGVASYSGDGGPAASAGLSSPTGVAVDASGNLYIADYVNNRIRVVSSGTITTVAGNGTAGFSGDGGSAVSAQLYNPTGVAVAPAPSPLVGP